MPVLLKNSPVSVSVVFELTIRNVNSSLNLMSYLFNSLCECVDVADRIIRGIPSHMLCSPGGEENSEVSSDSSGNNPQPPPLETLPPMENNARYLFH